MSVFARDFQQLLGEHRIACSMCRKGNCWDNAPTEHFFAEFKAEWDHRVEYVDHDDAKRHLFECMEVFVTIASANTRR